MYESHYCSFIISLFFNLDITSYIIIITAVCAATINATDAPATTSRSSTIHTIAALLSALGFTGAALLLF
jgi:hypothetical protein